jgi:single-strand DNA-binding protein
MANFNKVILMGNLTRDPELRQTPGGTGVCEFGLAMNRVYKTQSGERREETCFVDIVVWGRQGENCARYLSKGRPALIEGRLAYDTWEARDGSKRSRLRVVAETVQFLGGAGGGGGGGSSSGRGYGSERGGDQDQGESSEHEPARSVAESVPANRPPAPEEYDLDDVPF